MNEYEYDNFISENINTCTTVFYGKCTILNEIITFKHLPTNR